jgi:hypothetical protein
MHANHPEVFVVIGVFATWAFIAVIIKICYGQCDSRWIGHHGPGPWSPELILLAVLCGFMKDIIYVCPMSNITGVLKIHYILDVTEGE